MTAWLGSNWQHHPWLRRKVVWRKGTASPWELYIAEVDDKVWTIRMNDFPDEPLYTLLIDGVPVIHFDDWPEESMGWGPKPAPSSG
jgi:hypothetical protein